MQKSRKIALILAVVIGLWILSGLVLGGSDKPEEASAQSESMNAGDLIKIETLQARQKVRYLNLNGVTEAERAVMLKAETVGAVEQVHVAEGSVVKAGQLLISLDERERRSRI